MTKLKPIYIKINSRCSLCFKKYPLELRHVRGQKKETKAGDTKFIHEDHFQLRQLCYICVGRTDRDIQKFGLGNVEIELGHWKIN